MTPSSSPSKTIKEEDSTLPEAQITARPHRQLADVTGQPNVQLTFIPYTLHKTPRERLPWEVPNMSLSKGLDKLACTPVPSNPPHPPAFGVFSSKKLDPSRNLPWEVTNMFLSEGLGELACTPVPSNPFNPPAFGVFSCEILDPPVDEPPESQQSDHIPVPDSSFNSSENVPLESQRQCKQCTQPASKVSDLTFVYDYLADYLT
jgi:hypothetical protein